MWESVETDDNVDKLDEVNDKDEHRYTIHCYECDKNGNMIENTAMKLNTDDGFMAYFIGGGEFI